MVYKDIGEEMLEHAFEGKLANAAFTISFIKNLKYSSNVKIK
jgi:hypothetical protein